MGFHVGQQVVCVHALPDFGCVWDTDEAPEQGRIYTVHRVFVDGDGELILWLHEIRRSDETIRQYGPETGYGAYRFRPLDEHRMEQFRVHLAAVHIRERA